MRAAARVLRPDGLYVAAVPGAESQMDQVWAVLWSMQRKQALWRTALVGVRCCAGAVTIMRGRMHTVPQ